MRAKGYRNMLVSSPSEVEALVRKIPKGKVVTSEDLRASLAKASGADFTCPLSTGIFLWLISNAAEEERPLKGEAVTPYWRVLKTKGELNPKYPGGIESHAKLLEAEGIQVQGKRAVNLEAIKSKL